MEHVCVPVKMADFTMEHVCVLHQLKHFVVEHVCVPDKMSHFTMEHVCVLHQLKHFAVEHVCVPDKMADFTMEHVCVLDQMKHFAVEHVCVLHKMADFTMEHVCVLHKIADFAMECICVPHENSLADHFHTSFSRLYFKDQWVRICQGRFREPKYSYQQTALQLKKEKVVINDMAPSPCYCPACLYALPSGQESNSVAVIVCFED